MHGVQSYPEGVLYPVVLQLRALVISESSDFPGIRYCQNSVQHHVLMGIYLFFVSPGGGLAIYRAGRRLGISWTPRPGTVASRGAEVVVAGGLLVLVGFGVGVGAQGA